LLNIRVCTGHGKPGKVIDFMFQAGSPEIEVWGMERHGKATNIQRMTGPKKLTS